MPQRPYHEPSLSWFFSRARTPAFIEGCCFERFVYLPKNSNVLPVKSGEGGSVKINSAFSIGSSLNKGLFVFFSNAAHPPPWLCIDKTHNMPLSQLCRYSTFEATDRAIALRDAVVSSTSGWKVLICENPHPPGKPSGLCKTQSPYRWCWRFNKYSLARTTIGSSGWTPASCAA